MLSVSKELVREIYNDGVAAYNDPGHPCHPFVKWQTDFGCSGFQLPEPFSGKGSSLGILILGLNPSIDPNEDFPTANPLAPFEKYDQFFRNRFNRNSRDKLGRLVFRKKDGSEGLPHFWRGIERFGSLYLAPRIGEPFLLGESAIISQVMRFKATEGWHGNNTGERQAIWEHEQRITRKFIFETKPRVIVTAGEKALEGVFQVFDTPLPFKFLRDYYGREQVLEHPDCGKILVCPSKHFSRPMNSEESKLVAGSILRALEA